MTHRSEPPLRAADDARGFPLVVLAYRSVMAELSGANAKYRAGVWEAFEAAAPPGEAEALFGACVLVRARACSPSPIGRCNGGDLLRASLPRRVAGRAR